MTILSPYHNAESLKEGEYTFFKKNTLNFIAIKISFESIIIKKNV